jgi:hypothetical protein
MMMALVDNLALVVPASSRRPCSMASFPLINQRNVFLINKMARLLSPFSHLKII